MDILIDDIILSIMQLLSDRDKIKFMSSSKRLFLLNNRVYFDDLIRLKIIYGSYCYDRFTNILIYNSDYDLLELPYRSLNLERKLPKSIKKIHFNCVNSHHIKNYFPDTVTHLSFSFGSAFNGNIKD